MLLVCYPLLLCNCCCSCYFVVVVAAAVYIMCSLHLSLPRVPEERKLRLWPHPLPVDVDERVSVGAVLLVLSAQDVQELVHDRGGVLI